MKTGFTTPHISPKAYDAADFTSSLADENENRITDMISDWLLKSLKNKNNL